jgi:phage baseplate assembly protein W
MPDDSSFLGTGWSFPPTFASNGADVETVSAAEDVRQSLEILLGTQPGERILLEQFGCDLHRFLFEEVDQGLVNSLTGLISDAILFYEPRITLNDLDISQSDAEAGLLLISIDYTIRTTNSRYNMVYPFYLTEAIAPGG